MAGGKQLAFGGPYGPLALYLVLPLIVAALHFACTKDGCLYVYPELKLPPMPSLNQTFFSLEALAVVVGWIGFLAVLYFVLPGRVYEGVALKNGTRLKYPGNGFATLLVTAVAYVFLVSAGLVSPTYVYDNFVPLLGAVVAFAAAVTVALYLKSFARGAVLADEGNTGYPWYDAFMGRELNPRVGGLDLKYFFELRPGLIGWVLMNAAMAAAQYRSLGRVTNSMLLVNVFQGFYVADALFFEQAILTTMDIVHDGLGFMLVFGDLAWVPFLYSLQARYLLHNPIDWAPWQVAALCALNFGGYVVFRLSNLEKNRFRANPNDPKVAHLQYLTTESGSRLITSGWWGAARHINYLGDWLMGLAQSLACGIASPVPFFFPLYFAILLIHRERRDDHKCALKYGRDWRKYCELVPYRIVPYVY